MVSAMAFFCTDICTLHGKLCEKEQLFFAFASFMINFTML
jgi:hypothetical protein